MLEKSKFCLDIFILCLFLPTSFPRSPSIFCSGIKSYCPITNLSCVHLECFKRIDRLHFKHIPQMPEPFGWFCTHTAGPFPPCSSCPCAEVSAPGSASRSQGQGVHGNM
ncbi:hypothetical protein K5549_008409, partial [Capra hircus]